jgi:acyl carrier protein
MATIEMELRAFLRENFIFVDEDKIQDDSSFLQLGVIDSTGMLELMAFLEGQYKIVLDDSELVPENLDSINAVAQLVRRKLEARSMSGLTTPVTSHVSTTTAVDN